MQVLDRVNAGLLDQIEKSIGRGLHADVNRGDVSGMIRELTIRILQLCRRGATRMADELRMVGDVRVRLHPCLRDVWHDHLLFTNDDLTGLIDPSACRMENVACDLSRLIGSLVGDDRSRWDFALAEYQRSRPLSLDELRLVGVLNRSGVLLSGWTWLEWIYLQQRTFPNPLAVIDRLNEIVRRLEILIAEDSSALSIK